MMYALKEEDFMRYRDELFSHMISVNIYTPLCFFFSLQDVSTKSQIIEKLTRGIEQLSENFPWLTGQVLRSRTTVGQSVPYRVSSYKNKCRLIIKDYSNDTSFPSLAEFRKAKFPCRMIDGDSLTSLTGIPNSRPGDPTPVFFVQANFLTDGLVLSFAGEHSLLDGHGVGQIIRLLSQACNKSGYTEAELREGNRTAQGMIPLLNKGTYRPGPELDFLIEQLQNSSLDVTNNPPAQCSWSFVKFTASQLSILKALSEPSRSTTAESSVSHITTNDAITAFIWQCISRVRMNRLPGATRSTVGRAVDARSALSVSASYLGNMSNHSYTTMPLSTVSCTPLDVLASTLRSKLQPSDIAYGIRSLATYVAQGKDLSKVHYGANMDFSHDIFISSWARLPSYQHDFGLGLGLPEAVRRPGFLPIEGLLYLLPMDREGDIEAMICLRDDDLELLRVDKYFSAYSEWIG